MELSNAPPTLPTQIGTINAKPHPQGWKCQWLLGSLLMLLVIILFCYSSTYADKFMYLYREEEKKK